MSTAKAITIPRELELTRANALRAISPISPVDKTQIEDESFVFGARRTKASDDLPSYYLVYFLFVDLLEFHNLGKYFEKVAWSVPIEFNGGLFCIEHRKFGVGVFAQDATKKEKEAHEIVALIRRGVKVAQPFFEWLADRAVHESKLNVVNRARSLFARFEYFLNAHRELANEAIECADEWDVQITKILAGTRYGYFMPATELECKAWMELAAIDAFFSWTEHTFVHIAILTGKVTSGLEVAELADMEWQTKFKRALDVQSTKTKLLFDKLIVIRRQLRNFMAHGAFGKQREAFSFHSGAGAVPILLPHQRMKHHFSLGGGSEMREVGALNVIEEFIRHLWSGSLEPAELYIQKSNLPLILTMATDGSYQRAMPSVRDMEECILRLHYQFDRAANMDW